LLQGSAPREERMNGLSVFMTAFVTSALTAVGATYVIQRAQLFAQAPPERSRSAPVLTGLSEADARANAQALQLALLVGGREAAAGVKAGTVLRQSIAPGQPVSEGGSVSVVLAESLPHVPKVTELDLEEAKAALTHAGYRAVEGEPVPHPLLAVGRVVQQSPDADAELEQGGMVTLRASSGPASVEAPALAGMRVGEAKDKLADLGLKLEVRWISKAETVTDTVLSQKPKPGAALAPHATVEVVANR
jgi:beta-lactam-binding protein with PASTA domain